MNPQEEYDNLDQDYINIQEADWRDIASAEPEQIILEEEPVAIESETKEEELTAEEGSEQAEKTAATDKENQTSEGDIANELVEKMDQVENSPLSVEAVIAKIEAAAEQENIVLEEGENTQIADQVIQDYKQKMQSAKLEDLQDNESVVINLENIIQEALENYTPIESMTLGAQREDIETILEELQENENKVAEQPSQEAKTSVLQEIIEELAEDKGLEVEVVTNDELIEEQVASMLVQENAEEEVEEKIISLGELSDRQNTSNTIELVQQILDGGSLQFADEESKQVFDEVYRLASEQFKEQLDLLDKSDMTYEVDVNVDAFVIGGENENQLGEVAYEFHKDYTKDKIVIQVGKNVVFKEGTLADELTGAIQYQQGKMGFALKPDGQVVAVGYDKQDEIETKINALQIAEAKLAEVQLIDPEATLPKDDASFKNYHSTGNYDGYFENDIYGQMYEFSNPDNSPAFGTANNPLQWSKAINDAIFDAFSLKANVEKDEENNTIMVPGGDSLIQGRWSGSEHLKE
mgnify:CR=1 FL=1